MWIEEMDTHSAYMSKSQYMQSYWFSNKSTINIIYNISVVTLTITMSIILANFGKYAISDCPFINLVNLCVPTACCIECIAKESDYENSWCSSIFIKWHVHLQACYFNTIAALPNGRQSFVNVDQSKKYIYIIFRFELRMKNYMRYTILSWPN